LLGGAAEQSSFVGHVVDILIESGLASMCVVNGKPGVQLNDRGKLYAAQLIDRREGKDGDGVLKRDIDALLKLHNDAMASIDSRRRYHLKRRGYIYYEGDKSILTPKGLDAIRAHL
jgi:hypothetical protein